MLDRSATRLVLAAVLLAAPILVPSAGAHSAAAIELEVREREACLQGSVCLELVSLPPDLEPGHDTAFELRVHPNASRAYAASLTTADEADPDREATPEEAAIVTTPSAEPGERARANFTAPQASQLYAWLPGGEKEANGGWETLPLGVQGQQPSGDQDAIPAGGLAAVLASAMAAGLRRHGAS